MDTIKLLDSMEIGAPVVVTTKQQGSTMRKVSLYAGNDGMGKYSFIDDSGIYQYTAGYIRNHVTIQTELDQDEDIFALVKLIKEVKEGR